MNAFPCQSYEAEAELKYNSMPKDNIISAQEGKNIVTIVQDSLIACYLMTKNNMRIPKGIFFDICSRGELPDGSFLWNPRKMDLIKKLGCIEKDKDLYTGRTLFSLLLPETLFYTQKNNTMANEPIVKIVQGVYLEGAIDKNVLGSAHNSLLQVINKEYGPDFVGNFVDNVHFIAGGWMAYHGFSVGLEDCLLSSEDAKMTIRNTVTECYMKAESIEQSTFNTGIKEVRVIGALSQARDIGMKISKEAMSEKNNFLTTVISGAKGDYFNIAQLTSLLGQQNLEGQRVGYQLNNRTRTLPHYPLGKGMTKEAEYESRGFVKNSFIHGLEPEEFFFHAMSGREGVCDTAMSTANSGYIQRKILKTCEDIQVKYDGTVRDSVGKIYQYSYGSLGFDATKVVPVPGFSTKQPCDVGRLVQKLNYIHEEKLEDLSDESEPELEYEYEEPKVATRPKITQRDPKVTQKGEKKVSKKKSLVKQIISLRNETKISEDWDVDDLERVLSAIKLGEYSSDTDESEPENLDIDLADLDTDEEDSDFSEDLPQEEGEEEEFKPDVEEEVEEDLDDQDEAIVDDFSDVGDDFDDVE